jgi:PGF-CTERM protein
MTDRKLTVTTGAATSLLLVAVLVVSVFGSVGTTGASESSIDATAIQESDDVEAADEVYVKDNGDAVLVYQGEDGEDYDNMESMDLGVSASEGLVHVLVEGTPEEMESNASGGMTLLLEQDKFSGEGNLQMDRPEDLEELSLDVSAERTSEVNQFDATLDATMSGASETSGGVESAQTSGDMQLTADTFSTNGEFEANYGSPQIGQFSYDVGIQSTDTGYVVDVTQDDRVSERQKDQWETEDAARQTLERQYAGLAGQFGGSSSVTVHSHSFEQTAGGTYNLQISYTIEYKNVKDGVATMLEQQLANDEQLELTEQEASQTAQAVVDLEIRTLDVSVEQTERTTTGSWTVEIGNYDQLVRSGLTIAENQAEDDNVTEQIDRARTMLDAQQASGLKQTVEWSASMSQDGDQATVSAELHSSSSNWNAYISELEDRGISAAENDISMELSAQTEGEELTADMSMSVKQEELVDSMVNSMIQSASQDPSTDEETQQVLSKLEQSEFQVGKLDVSFDDEAVTVEAGAKFDNISALSSEMNEAYGGHQITQVVGQYDNESDTDEMHVHVNNLVSEDADESDVRALAVADEDTEIHTDDWDREFPDMDTQGAKQFLGIDGEDNQDGEDDEDSSLPGFGPAVAVIALVGAALIARRQR